MLSEHIDFLLQDNWAWNEMAKELRGMCLMPYGRSAQIVDHIDTMDEIAAGSALYDGYLFH